MKYWGCNTSPSVDTNPKALTMDWKPLPSSLTNTKGLWDCRPTVLAWAHLVGCWQGEENCVMFAPEGLPMIAAPVNHSNTPWLAFFFGCIPRIQISEQNPQLGSTPFPSLNCVPPPSLSRPARWARTKNKDQWIFICLKHQKDVTTLVMKR